MKDTTKSLLLHRIGESLLVIVPAVIGLLVSPEAKWTLPAQTVCATAGALLGVALVFWKWSRELKEKVSDVELVAAARSAGRPVCDCTKVGVVMLTKPEKGRDYYVCPECGAEILPSPPRSFGY